MKFIRHGNQLRHLSALPPGLQLYTVRHELEKDVPGTLKKVAQDGYQVVEYSIDNPEIPAVVLKSELNRLGLKLISIFNFMLTLENLEETLQYAQTVGARYIVTGYPPQSFADDNALNASIASLRSVGKIVKQRGMQLLYHPHDWEYQVREGQRILDRLLSGVGTDVMQLELDMYWAKKGGTDPYQTLLNYKGLSPLIHIKDMDENGGFTEVGRGTIDWTPIFCSFRDVGVKQYYVEQDESPDPMRSIQISLHYIQSRFG